MAFVDLQINTSFEQRLTVLRPSIPEPEALALRAEWASMSSCVDYLRLTKKMDDRARELGVRLPEPLLQ